MNGPGLAGLPRFRRLSIIFLLPLLAVFLSGCTGREPPEAPTPVQPPPLSKLEIQSLGSPLLVGDSQPLSIRALDANQQERKEVTITWASENPAVAAVGPQGIVTAMAPGSTTLTASGEGQSASIPVEVKNPPVSQLEIQSSTVSLTVGDAQPFQVVATDSKNREIKGLPTLWKSKNPSIASVDEKGLVMALAPGKATIVATVADQKASAVLTVSNPPIAKIEIRPAAAILRVGETKRLETLVQDAKNREQKEISVVWHTDNPSIASVSNAGLVTARAAGAALITVSVAGITSSPVLITVKDKESPLPPVSKKEDLKTEYKNLDPSQLIYLSGITGEMAGTGDPTKYAGEAEQAGRSQHPLALELSDLPKDRYGLIDWAAAIKAGKIKPRHSLDPKTGSDEAALQLDVVIFSKSQFQPDVIFPHFVHTLWLTCANCHPSIFPTNAKEANKMMTMPKIAAGEFCGRCHNRVAFPLSDCLRCHVKPKDIPPIDPDYQALTRGKTP